MKTLVLKHKTNEYLKNFENLNPLDCIQTVLATLKNTNHNFLIEK